VGDDRAVGSPGVGRRGLGPRTAPLALLVASLFPALVECGLDEQSLGAACVKGEDCLSGFCSDQICVAAPPLLDADVSVSDGAIEAAIDAATDSAKPHPDARPDAPDAPPDAIVEASTDASDVAAEVTSDHAATDAMGKDAKGSEG
jgi:hypothetical protein